MQRNLIALILGIGIIFLAANLPTFNNSLVKSDLTSGAVASLEELEVLKNPFEGIKLEAKSAYVFDIKQTQEIFSLNPEDKLGLASLTKLMTALVAKERIPEYVLSPISKEAVLQEGDEGLIVDEQWLVSDLIDVMLISSSNDAAYALAEGYRGSTSAAGATRGRTSEFVNLMNQKAAELGLTQTYFFNPTGLDISPIQAGSYGSAKDIGKLLLHIMNTGPSLFEATHYQSLVINGRRFENTNEIINEIPRIFFGKTGFSDLAGGNLAIVADLGFEHPVIIVVLGSTEQGRFNDVKALYRALEIRN